MRWRSAASQRGARVILDSGPVNLPAPAGIEVIPIRTAHEMRKAVMSHLEQSTNHHQERPQWRITSYRNVPQQKMKKTAARWSPRT